MAGRGEEEAVWGEGERGVVWGENEGVSHGVPGMGMEEVDS